MSNTNTDTDAILKRRAADAAAMRQYRLRHPERCVVNKLRCARNLLQRYGFTVEGGNIDLSDIRALDPTKVGEHQ